MSHSLRPSSFNSYAQNHIHLVFSTKNRQKLVKREFLPPLTEAVALVKSNSSKWLREHHPEFAWQEGYGAFSVSSSRIDATIRYIQTQELHHGKISFEDEFIALLKKADACRTLRGLLLLAFFPGASAPGLDSSAPPALPESNTGGPAKTGVPVSPRRQRKPLILLWLIACLTLFISSTRFLLTIHTLIGYQIV